MRLKTSILPGPGVRRALGLVGLVVCAGLALGLLTARAEGPAGLARAQAAEASAPGGLLAGSASRGQALYQERCAACHAVDTNDAGPLHRGVLGRRAGTVPGFDYSPALRASRLVWTRQSLDAWLRNPEALIPGQAMDEQVADPQARQDLIAYLATLR
ncbi:c-type cytochrome [Curvibacter gracilis]|uniref:c-type cytochrome n=1 Tax=Curvibacter gracilis TaxID=230310 RepID=UPI0004AE0062|nr:c-type cytochrome [Curvibacter gracilis]